MSYDAGNQKRVVALVRGRGQEQMDSILPVLAAMVDDSTPAEFEQFRSSLDAALSQVLPDASAKTVANYRTEIAGRLLGLYFVDSDGHVHVSDRARRFVLGPEGADQPALFKHLCSKLQVPSGLSDETHLLEYVQMGVSFQPCAWVLQVLQLAEDAEMVLLDTELAFFVLNSADVMEGRATPSEVVAAIVAYRRAGRQYFVGDPSQPASYNMQHIREILNYMALANLIRVDGHEVRVNRRESEAVNHISSLAGCPLGFDVNGYDLSDSQGRRAFRADWQVYYTSVDELAAEALETPTEALGNPSEIAQEVQAVAGGVPVSSADVGKMGELLVYARERKRVASYDSRLLGRVKLVADTTGLGFDVQSVRACEPNPDFAVYIEVKSTRRVTAPKVSLDRVTLTRNEWSAARQHRDDYIIRRVYFTGEGPRFADIKNPASLSEDGSIRVEPETYTLEFGDKVASLYE